MRRAEKERQTRQAERETEAEGGRKRETEADREIAICLYSGVESYKTWPSPIPSCFSVLVGPVCYEFPPEIEQARA